MVSRLRMVSRFRWCCWTSHCGTECFLWNVVQIERVREMHCRGQSRSFRFDGQKGWGIIRISVNWPKHKSEIPTVFFLRFTPCASEGTGECKPRVRTALIGFRYFWTCFSSAFGALPWEERGSLLLRTAKALPFGEGFKGFEGLSWNNFAERKLRGCVRGAHVVRIGSYWKIGLFLNGRIFKYTNFKHE